MTFDKYKDKVLQCMNKWFPDSIKENMEIIAVYEQDIRVCYDNEWRVECCAGSIHDDYPLGIVKGHYEKMHRPIKSQYELIEERKKRIEMGLIDKRTCEGFIPNYSENNRKFEELLALIKPSTKSMCLHIDLRPDGYNEDKR